MEPATKLADALQSGRLALTAEFVPPTGADAETVRRQALSLSAGLDAVVVADNHEGIGVSAMACCSILAAQGIEPVLTISTRDRNRIALQSDVLGGAMLGVTNVLCLSGDHQSLGVCPEAAGAFDIDSIQLIQALASMRDEGILFGGKPLQYRPPLFIGAAAHPDLRPTELALITLRKKVAAGAQFLLTQPVFDVERFAEWMTAVREACLHERTHIIASVCPLTSAEQAERLAAPDRLTARLSESGDFGAEGVRACTEIVEQLKNVEGVGGIHFLSSGADDVATKVIQQVGLSRV